MSTSSLRLIGPRIGGLRLACLNFSFELFLAANV